MHSFHKFIKHHSPLLLIFLISSLIATQNIDFNTIYSGWDNVHPEFNLAQYAKRMFFGAWLDYQGMGAAAGQGHLTEITRIPLLCLLNIFIPTNHNRYAWIFLMFFIGGMTMYFYIAKVWLAKMNYLKNWIAGLCALYYQLNLLTLQQFYISFEMFTVQFAFFPFLLLTIHFLSKKITTFSLLMFIFVQLLISSSGHTPTVFYLSAVISFCYAFFACLYIGRSIRATIKTTFLIILLTVISNAYWILPNMYYIVHNSHYVIESRANQLFGMESIWSIRQAGNLYSLFTGIHYIFTWQNYNFVLHTQDFIFTLWKEYVKNPLIFSSIFLFSLFSLFGFLFLILLSQWKHLRWAVILPFISIILMVWPDIFLSNQLVNKLYSIKVIQESFRNAFTKLSIIYSAFLSILLSVFYLHIVSTLKRVNKEGPGQVAAPVFILFSYFMVVIIALPSFFGYFINPKLKVSYPSEYKEMFDYLGTRNPTSRVLELPYYSHEGWVLYDWQEKAKSNGYQGIGFHFFAIPQPFLTPDFGRWSETSDFFYHELKYALNNKSASLLHLLLDKYRIGFVIIDENAINKYSSEDNIAMTKEVVSNAGLRLTWSKNKLSIYENVSYTNQDNTFIIPKKMSFVEANTNRVVEDVVYQDQGEYINQSSEPRQFIYPFADISSSKPCNYKTTSSGLELKRRIVNEYEHILTVPAYSKKFYTTVALISYKNDVLTIKYPKTSIFTQNTTYHYPQIPDIQIKTKKNYNSVYLWLNNKQIAINNKQTFFRNLTIPIGTKTDLYIGRITDDGLVDDITSYTVAQPDWSIFLQKTQIPIEKSAYIGFRIDFPPEKADIMQTFVQSDEFSEKKWSTVSKGNSVQYTADIFGVNPGSFSFNSLTTNQSYVLHIQGKQIKGRSIKIFLRPDIKNTLAEEYLMPENSYNKFINLFPISDDIESSYFLDWETRSFGKESQNELSKLQIFPVPLEQISKISISKPHPQVALNSLDDLKNVAHPINYIYIVSPQCNDIANCYVGINQSYDDLWIGIDSKLHILPHMRYNNWANIWKINTNQHPVFFIYIPGILSLISLILLIVLIFFLLGKLLIYRFNKQYAN